MPPSAICQDSAPPHRVFVLDSLAVRFWALVFSLLALILPHTVSIHALPGIKCTFLAWTGYSCPFCGTTRSLWAMANGDILRAFHNSPLGALLYPAAWVVLLYNAVLFFAELRCGKRIRCLALRWRPLGCLLAAAVAANWIYRLAFGLR